MTKKPKFELIGKSEQLKGLPRFYTYHDKDQNLIGTILVLETGNNECLVWEVFVVPEYRRQGLGEFILNCLKNDYKAIVTSFRSEAGKKLVEKCGFEMVTSKNNRPQYVWIKEEEEDAGKDKKY